MNYKAARTAIRAFFATAWGTRTPVAYDDVVYEPNGSPYVAFNISHYDGEQASIGSPGANLQRRYGLINAQLFHPSGKGTNPAWDNAEMIVSLFLGPTPAGIHFYDIQAQEKGNYNGYYQINVLIYFRYDHIA